MLFPATIPHNRKHPPRLNSGVATATVTGTAQVGSTLTCTFNNNDPDGAATAGPTFQWIRGASTVIAGATASTYVAVHADYNQTLRCQVGYTDGAGFIEGINSNSTAALAGLDTGNATAGISGTASQGQVMTATFNNNDPQGAAISGPTFQWYRGGSTPISGATASTYTLQSADVGGTVKCVLQYTDGEGFAETIETANSAVVVVGDTGDATASVAFANGIAQVGQTCNVTFHNNDPDGAASGISYQWFASGNLIGGATGTGFVPTGSQSGQTLSCRVNYTDALGNAESIFSPNSATVAGVTVGVFFLQDANGVGSFGMPNYNTARLEVWGAGCGGSAANVAGAPVSPSAAGNSSCTSPGISLSAQGGQPPSGGTTTTVQTQGAAATASGGNVTNLNGGLAGVGQVNTGANSLSGAGGDAPGGGVGGAGVNHDTSTSNANGVAGSAPGGGGSGNASGLSSVARSKGTAGGNAGAYACSDYILGGGPSPSIGATFIATVGAASSGANSAGTVGGAGTNGRVRLTVTS